MDEVDTAQKAGEEISGGASLVVPEPTQVVSESAQVVPEPVHVDTTNGEWSDHNEMTEEELELSEAERLLAKSRADRAWAELKSMVYARQMMETSVFAGPGHAELTTSLGHFRLFKTVKQSAPVFSNLLRLNLLFFAMVILFFTYQVASSDKGLATPFLEFNLIGRMLPYIIASTAVLSAMAAVLWFLQRPKRLKVLPNMLVLRTEINADMFSELAIPWQTVEKVELTHVKSMGVSEIESRIEIRTALGVKHCVPLDDLLVDNSEASFVNAVRTYAPWAARDLTFNKAGDLELEDRGARLTELWLHQFNTGQGRKETGMLSPGSELKECDEQGNIVRTYNVLGIIGGGGQGNTYLASGQPPGAATAGEIVLKEYIMPVYRGSTALAKLGDKLGEEAALLARMNHPLIVKVQHHFVSDYRGYLVLEYVEGHSLKDLVNREGPQPEQFVVQVAQSLLAVLKYMHSFQPPIVHRDLSPDNVMLSITGQIKVVDFNVARQLEGSAGATVVGKHAYIPPEQFRGRPCPASDIYALGGTLHFLLTGREPEPLSPSHPRAINPKISAILDDVIARATALDLPERYGSADEMLAGLSRAQP